MGPEAGAKLPGRRRLIVNADDFGRSSSINRAVIRAHREGILTSASLMMNEPGLDEAVALAKANPNLGVGLHLTLLCGHSALPVETIPGLVNDRHEFTDNSFEAGVKYFFDRSIRTQLREEIHSQFDRFRATGLTLDHVNGHLHLHLHPVVFAILMQDAADLGLRSVRLTFDPFWLNLQLASGRLFYRASHAVIFGRLAKRARPALKERGLKHTHQVFGLLQNAEVNEQYICKLLPKLPSGDSELYSHPSLDDFKDEFDALVSRRVIDQVKGLAIELVRYQDL